MGGVSPETCWASHKCGIINFDTLLHLVGFFCVEFTMMHRSTNITVEVSSSINYEQKCFSKLCCYKFNPLNAELIPSAICWHY
jgi:hypothetical protein